MLDCWVVAFLLVDWIDWIERNRSRFACKSLTEGICKVFEMRGFAPAAEFYFSLEAGAEETFKSVLEEATRETEASPSLLQTLAAEKLRCLLQECSTLCEDAAGGASWTPSRGHSPPWDTYRLFTHSAAESTGNGSLENARGGQPGDSCQEVTWFAG